MVLLLMAKRLSKMNAKDRQIIKDKYNNKCAYCGCELPKIWQADHIQPIVRNSDGTCKNPQNEVLSNYNPSCPSCNTQKNSFTLEQFRSNIEQFVNSLNQYSTQYKFAKRYGLVTETNIKVKFYFETI
jgi:5-methylcytosine-specific restriction endonuclease McrA